MNFDPWNIFLKIQDSVKIPTLKMKIHLGVYGFIPSHSWKCKCDSRVLFLTFTFPCICFGHEPKAKVETFLHYIHILSWRKNYTL